MCNCKVTVDLAVSLIFSCKLNDYLTNWSLVYYPLALVAKKVESRLEEMTIIPGNDQTNNIQVCYC